MSTNKMNGMGLLRKITRNFFLQVPFRCFEEELKKYIADNPTEVLNNTILHKLNKEYPLKKSFLVSFMKNIINMLEEIGEEVEESFYHYYLNSMKEKNEETHYVHFPLENGRFISILQNTNIISGGTTGLSIWQAGTVLAEYCFENNVFTDKCILELGCGVGLTGLAVIFTCHPSHYCFSDAHKKVLDYLIENIKLNMPGKIPIFDSSYAKNETDLYYECSYDDTKISVVDFAWENADDSKFCKSFNPDVILAADVVYDSELFKPLCHALSLFIHRNRNVKILISCTVRNVLTLTEFFVILHEFNLIETEIKAVTTWNSSYNDESVVKIFSIRSTEQGNVGDG